jgi:hypothetical protein
LPPSPLLMPTPRLQLETGSTMDIPVGCSHRLVDPNLTNGNTGWLQPFKTS